MFYVVYSNNHNDCSSELSARQLSRNVSADAGFLRDKASPLDAAVIDTLCMVDNKLKI